MTNGLIAVIAGAMFLAAGAVAGRLATRAPAEDAVAQRNRYAYRGGVVAGAGFLVVGVALLFKAALD